jgi:hypothetical protein
VTSCDQTTPGVSPACQPAQQLARLPACLPARLPACLLACLPACLLACLPSWPRTHTAAARPSTRLRATYTPFRHRVLPCTSQLLNARVHARNFPNLVRATPLVGCANPGGRLTLDDVQWLVSFEASEASEAESGALRESVAGLQQTIGANSLLSAPVDGHTYS